MNSVVFIKAQFTILKSLQKLTFKKYFGTSYSFADNVVHPAYMKGRFGAVTEFKSR